MKKNYIPILFVSVIALFSAKAFSQENDTLLFSQDTNPQSGIASSVAAEDGEGYYAADDFMLDEDATISTMIFPGYQFLDNLEDIYTGVVLYIYEDDNGKPNGIPGKSGTPIYSLDLDRSDSQLELNSEGEFNYEFTVHTADLSLEGQKIYWVVFAVKIDFETKLDSIEMWTWNNSTNFQYNDAVNIDPDDFFGSGLTYWLSIYVMTGGTLGDDVKGMSFFLYGEGDVMGINEDVFANQIKVFPNPTSNKINVSTPQNGEVKTINVYDLAGRLVSVFKNSSTVDVSHLKSGSYLMEISFDNGSNFIRKFMKI